jgi:hypothetical protein
MIDFHAIPHELEKRGQSSMTVQFLGQRVIGCGHHWRSEQAQEPPLSG